METPNLMPLMSPGLERDIEDLYRQSFEEVSPWRTEAPEPTAANLTPLPIGPPDAQSGAPVVAATAAPPPPVVVIPRAVQNEMARRKRPAMRRSLVAKRQKATCQPGSLLLLASAAEAADSASAPQMGNAATTTTTTTTTATPKLPLQMNSFAQNMQAMTNPASEPASLIINNGRCCSFEYIRDTFEALVEPAIMCPVGGVQPLSNSRVKAHMAKLVFLNNAYNVWSNRVQNSKSLTIAELADIFTKSLLEVEIAAI